MEKKKERSACFPARINHMAEYRSSGKELRKSPKGLIAGVLTFALVTGAALAYRYVYTNLQPLESAPVDSAVDVVIPGMNETTEADPNRIRYENRDIYLSDLSRGALVLVNREHPIEDTEYGLVNVLEEKNNLLTVTDGTVVLQKQALEAFGAMAEGFADATGHHDLLIAEGYRTKAQQQQLYEGDLQRTGSNTSELYAVPGCCELESGMAAALRRYDGAFHEFTAEGDYAWILEHCAEYGLIQRYPVMREESTKVSGNEDIFRYVGVPHALYMEKHGLTMEEYILLLETYPFDGTHLLLRDNANKEYEVYFVSADRNSGLETTAVPVPANLHYAVSGSNANGFFVTVELPEDSGRTYPTDVITTPPRVTTQPAETT